MVQNEADSDLGKALIKAAKERGFTTINILPNKPGVSDSIELLKSIGGDVVVTEAYTNTWFELHSHAALFAWNSSVRVYCDVEGKARPRRLPFFYFLFLFKSTRSMFGRSFQGSTAVTCNLGYVSHLARIGKNWQVHEKVNQ